MTDISGSVVLVTGANGGLGTHFVGQALERGAATVYATARTPRTWDDERIVPLALDVTDAGSIRAVAEAAGDTTIVINNAGTIADESLLKMSLEEIRAAFETNVFGPIAVAQAFAPILGANGGGALVDIHSALSWFAQPGAYSSTKSAFWGATNTLRLELAGQGTHVLGAHLGYTDTPMIAGLDVPKGDAGEVVAAIYDGLAAGEFEVLADETARSVKQALSLPLTALYPSLTA